MITFPFKHNLWDIVHCRILAEAIEKEWLRFTNAKEIDNSDQSGLRLGTLRFLPFEIRQKMYSHVLNIGYDDVFETDHRLDYYEGVASQNSYQWHSGMHRALDNYLDGCLLY